MPAQYIPSLSNGFTLMSYNRLRAIHSTPDEVFHYLSNNQLFAHSALLEKLLQLKDQLDPRIFSSRTKYCDGVESALIEDIVTNYTAEFLFDAQLLPEDHLQPERPHIIFPPSMQSLLGRRILYDPAKPRKLPCSRVRLVAGYQLMLEKQMKLTEELDREKNEVPEHIDPRQIEYKEKWVTNLKRCLKIVLSQCDDWVVRFESDLSNATKRKEYLEMCRLLRCVGRDVEFEWLSGVMKGKKLIGKVEYMARDEEEGRATLRGTANTGEEFMETFFLANLSSDLGHKVIELDTGKPVASEEVEPLNEWFGTENLMGMDAAEPASVSDARSSFDVCL